MRLPDMSGMSPDRPADGVSDWQLAQSIIQSYLRGYAFKSTHSTLGDDKRAWIYYSYSVESRLKNYSKCGIMNLVDNVSLGWRR